MPRGRSDPVCRTLPVRDVDAKVLVQPLPQRFPMPRLTLPLILALSASIALAGCGADGAPEQPAPKTGIAVSGEAQIGVVFK
jgi:hypothetical protein